VSGDAAYDEAMGWLCELCERQSELSTSLHLAVMDTFNTLVELGPPGPPERGTGGALSIGELLAATIDSIDRAASAGTGLSGHLRLAEARRVLSAAAGQP
jgi:hypothetical protein